MDGFEAWQIPGTEGARAPFFSPDGEWIGFWGDGKLKKMPVTGGAPTIICDAPNFFGASWAADDSIFIGPGYSGLLRVGASGGEPEQVTIFDPESEGTGHSRPEVLPNGKAVLYHIYRGNAWDVAVKSLESNQQRILVEGGSSPLYLPTGHLLYARRETGRVEAVPFDSDRLEITGSPVPVFNDVWWALGAHFIVSNDGSLLYIHIPGQFREFGMSHLVWVDREGVAQIMTEEPRPYSQNAEISPDGSKMAVVSSGDIWVVDLARDAWARLTFDADNAMPVWSPDGSQIFFGSTRGGDAYQIFVVSSDGSGEARQLTEGGYRLPTSVSPDGKSLFLRQRGEDGSWDIGILRLDVDGEGEALFATPFNEHSGMISPAGLWLAYVSDESGRDEIYVRPFPDMNTEWSISTDGGTEPLWSSDGTELFYRHNDQMMAVSISTKPSFTPGRPNLLFEGTYLRTDASYPRTAYDVSANGERFVMLRPAEGAAPGQINVVLNWFEELNRLVPKRD
jgi:serine/threonine-protein kinase